MPLTPFQSKLALLLAKNRSYDSHLAGGAAIHLSPQSIRYSNDLDYFNDSDVRVAKAFEDDSRLMKASGYQITIELHQPGYIRSQVSLSQDSTKVEWSHDTSWRFMPVLKNELCGYILHPVDLAINKVLALAGRNEPRDMLDALHVHAVTLSLGALCWAACGKDPGFNPRSLLELLKRRGRFHSEDLRRLQLAKPIDLQELKQRWNEALSEAETFVLRRPPPEIGCLYYSVQEKEFVTPAKEHRLNEDYVLHFGRPGGVLPLIT